MQPHEVDHTLSVWKFCLDFFGYTLGAISAVCIAIVWTRYNLKKADVEQKDKKIEELRGLVGDAERTVAVRDSQLHDREEAMKVL